MHRYSLRLLLPFFVLASITTAIRAQQAKLGYQGLRSKTRDALPNAPRGMSLYRITYGPNQTEGYLLEPDDTGKHPLLIFNRGGHREFARLSPALMEQWLAPLCARGYAILASQYPEDEEFGGADVEDLRQLLRIGRRLPGVDSSRIGLYGWSRGGMECYLLLRNSCGIRAAVIGGAPSDLREVVSLRPGMDSLFRKMIPGYSTHKAQSLTDRSASCWPGELCRSTSFLLLHGGADERVSARQTVDMADTLQRMKYDCTVLVLKDDDHLMSRNAAARDTLIARWLKDHL